MLSKDFALEENATEDNEDYRSKSSESFSFASLADDQASQTTKTDLIMVIFHTLFCITKNKNKKIDAVSLCVYF